MADVILKDRDGNDVEYAGASAVQLVTADGGVQQFVAGEIVEKTVNPDFSGGDMEITPDSGTFLGKVTVTKPEGLIPENVAKDVDIAGIIGTFMGSKIATGTFTGNSGVYTLTHGLGVVPDVFIMYCPYGFTGNYTWVLNCWAISTKLKNATLFPQRGQSSFGSGNGGYYTGNTPSGGLEDAYVNGNSVFYEATEQTIKIGNTSHPTYKGTYTWLAIGGLT